LVLLLLLVPTAVGCQGWFPREPANPTPQPVTVRARTPTGWVTLHEAWLDGDSLRGRPAGAVRGSLVALPVAELDSLQVRDLDLGATAIAATGLFIAILYYVGLGLRGMN
jgi:hypothetical protein